MSEQISMDQSHGELTLHTGRQGVGSKVGHDLTIRVGRWSAQATTEGTNVFDLRVVADLTSLEVVRGDGGLKPLTDKDRATILSNAASALQVGNHPDLVFLASGPHDTKIATTVTGVVTLAGARKTQLLDVVVTRNGKGSTITVRGELVQSAFGIKPYSGLLGALKVRDMVEIRAEVRLPSD